MQEPSVFTRIINGEIPSHKIYEDDRAIAILTNHPLVEGHTLVIPKIQVDQIWDLSDDDYDYLWKVSRKVATHLREAQKARRIGVIIKGFEVPHVHIHLIPIPDNGQRVDFDPEPSPPITDDESLALVAKRLRF
jgi:histidine triad (HIT) family protein